MFCRILGPAEEEGVSSAAVNLDLFKARTGHFLGASTGALIGAPRGPKIPR